MLLMRLTVKKRMMGLRSASEELNGLRNRQDFLGTTLIYVMVFDDVPQTFDSG